MQIFFLTCIGDYDILRSEVGVTSYLYGQEGYCINIETGCPKDSFHLSPKNSRNEPELLSLMLYLHPADKQLLGQLVPWFPLHAYKFHKPFFSEPGNNDSFKQKYSCFPNLDIVTT